MSNHPQAADCYQQAVDIYQEIGDRFHEAGSYIGLGDAQLHAVGSAAARESWDQALAILESIPHEDAGLVRQRIAELAADKASAGSVSGVSPG
jgi:hypothetical protein